MTALPPAGDRRVCYLLDLSGWTRALYEVASPVRTSNDERVELTRAFCRRLRALFLARRPAFLGVGADVPGAPYARRALWPGYKAERKSPHQAYENQLERVIGLLALFRIPVFRGCGFEADDWIATAARRARAIGMRVVIVSNDHDLWQLIDDDGETIAWDGKSDTAIGATEVRARYHGVGPAQLADLWALAGQSDEAPGIEGLGEKTAAALLLKHGSLEEVLRKWQWARGKLIARLRDGAPLARLSRELVTLREAPLDFDPLDFRTGWGAGEVTAIREVADLLGLDALQEVTPLARQPLDDELMRRWIEASEDV